MHNYTGTSGWQYKHWYGEFYPEKLKNELLLPFYCCHFKTVEINSTFYRFPTQASVERWYDVTSEDFKFSVKLNKYFTHTKLLKLGDDTDERLESFLSLLLPLSDKLSVLLIQLPPRMRINLIRLEGFLDTLFYYMTIHDMKFKVAIEFRNETWFTDETIKLLKSYNVANVLSDNPGTWPIWPVSTANFGYVRLHGDRVLYSSKYTIDKIQEWNKHEQDYENEWSESYTYFDNDGHANAVMNALQLQLLQKQYVHIK